MLYRCGKDIKEKGFDKYGFAHVFINFIDYTSGIFVKFYTEDPSKNIIIQNKKLTVSNLVCFNVSVPTIDFKSFEKQLESLDIVETIKYLLKHDPVHTIEALENMPTCLYDNEEIAKDIFACISPSKDIINNATKVVRTKMAVMKKYQEDKAKDEAFKNQSVEDVKNVLLETYTKGKNELKK